MEKPGHLTEPTVCIWNRPWSDIGHRLKYVTVNSVCVIRFNVHGNISCTCKQALIRCQNYWSYNWQLTGWRQANIFLENDMYTMNDINILKNDTITRGYKYRSAETTWQNEDIALNTVGSSNGDWDEMFNSAVEGMAGYWKDKTKAKNSKGSNLFVSDDLPGRPNPGWPPLRPHPRRQIPFRMTCFQLPVRPSLILCRSNYA